MTPLRMSAKDARRLVIDVPMLPQINPAANVHWRARKQERDNLWDWVRAGLLAHTPLVCVKAHIICERHSAARAAPDADNLAFSFKQAIDALVHYGVIPDDSPEHITAEYQWHKAPRGQGFIRLTITEAT